MQIQPVRTHSFRHRAYALAILVLVYSFNFIDRRIVALLAFPSNMSEG